MPSILLNSVDDPKMSAPQKHKWQDDALCSQVGIDFFFPKKGGSVLDAKLICAGCDVLLKCLAYALEAEASEEAESGMKSHRYGFFGGLSPNQRMEIARLMKEHPQMTLEQAYLVVSRQGVRKGGKRGKLAASQESQAL